MIMGQRASSSYISKWVNVCKFLCFALFCEQEGTGDGYFFFPESLENCFSAASRAICIKPA